MRIAWLLAATAMIGAAPTEIVNFDKAETSKPPAGWTATQTGTGQAKWAVVQDDTAPSKPNVLKQSGQATYPVCLKDDTSLKDGFVEVKFKAVSGREDQAGGVVWRAKDVNNYYIARANALENNVTIYYTVNGRRTEKRRASVKVASNQWHTLRVDFQADHFTVSFNGQKALEWDDETFKDAGKVGVWTKADSVTLFDDFRIRTVGRMIHACADVSRGASLPRDPTQRPTGAAHHGPHHRAPRVEGRIDHLALDPTGEQLFVAALGNNTVEVVDVKNGTHLKSLPGFREPQGIASVPDAKLIAVANGQGDGIQLLDASDYRSAKAVPLGDDSDNVRYDAAAKRLYVGYGGGALAAIDPVDGKVSGTVRLTGHPESFQLERTGPRIFVNVPAAEHIAVVDRNAMTIVATWPVSGAKSNFPMALDEANHRMFVGCRKPAKVLIYDTTGGKEIGDFGIVGDTDDMFYDTQRQRLYVAGGEGFIDVLDARTPATLKRMARVNTAAGAVPRCLYPSRGGFTWPCRTEERKGPRSASTTSAISHDTQCPIGLRAV